MAVVDTGDFRRLIKNRLLVEMLGSIGAAGAADWSVLIMDPVSTRVMSHACQISEILDYGISLVENIEKKREPLLSISGVYFITPTDRSVQRLLDDWKVRPMYKTAHVFFTSKVSPVHLQVIKNCSGLAQRLRSLKEVNVELLTIDKRTFTTDEGNSLQTLFGENSEGSAQYRAEVSTMAARLATVFASLKEFPTIRFRAAKPGEDASTGLEARSLVAQRVAVDLNERLSAMQRSGQLPTGSTCDLVIFDRGFDPVAPVIHEWTYEAMAYDLLNLDGEVFRYDVETQAGKTEKKEHLLAETDDMWVALRHKHFAAATIEITRTLDEFRAKNKAAAYKQGGGGDGALDMRNMKNLVSSLPQYREQLSRLSVHVEIASKINQIIDAKDLTDLGKLEQDLVFGDATSKEIITYISTNQKMSAEDKVRLLMSYVITHPEKMDDARQQQWQRLAHLTDMDMNTINNLELLGVPVKKKGSTKSGIGLTFGRKRKRAVRKDRDVDEGDEQWSLSRFAPLMQEVLEDLAANKLNFDEYPYVQPPSNDSGSSYAPSAKGASVRSNKTSVGWAKKAAGAREEALSPKGKRIVAFVVGGVTRSEMRVAHKLSAKLGREILIGSTSCDTPTTFLKSLQNLGSLEQVALEIDGNGGLSPGSGYGSGGGFGSGNLTTIV